MRRRAITIVPIVVGSLGGGLLAWFGAAPSKSSSTVSAASTTARPWAAAAKAASVLTPTTAAPRIAAAASAPEAPAAAAPLPSASGALPSEAASAAAAASAGANSPVFDLTAPATAPELMTAQIGCNRQIPEDCERAGRSLESGSAGVTDATRARGLRRIALTLYVKQCETSNRVAACLRLAEMYDVGELVQANPKNAEALRLRAKTLCGTRPDDADCRQ